jgi:hypothetical protein
VWYNILQFVCENALATVFTKITSIKLLNVYRNIELVLIKLSVKMDRGLWSKIHRITERERERKRMANLTFDESCSIAKKKKDKVTL